MLLHVDIKQISLISYCNKYWFIIVESFEGRGVQKSIFQNYFKTNQIAGSTNYGELFHGKYWGCLKIMSNEDC